MIRSRDLVISSRDLVIISRDLMIILRDLVIISRDLAIICLDSNTYFLSGPKVLSKMCEKSRDLVII